MTRSDQDVSAVQRSQEFYRLKETIESQGAIFELNESSKAMYIGPDSDIGEVQVTYYNPDEPDSLETAVVSVNGPLVGRVDSLPSTMVSSTNQPARILVSPVDIVKPDYDPGSFVTMSFASLPAQRTYRVPVVLDFMIALKPLPSIPEVRADRTIRLPRIPYTISNSDPANNGSTNIIVPIYGRRMVTIQAINYDTTRSAAVQLGLVSLTPGSINTTPRWLAGAFQGAAQYGAFLAPLNDVNQPYPAAAVIRASDAARAGVTTDLNAAVNGAYIESDYPPMQTPVGNSGIGIFRGAPRGMADLLLINLSEYDFGGAAAEHTGYVDLFIKLADRET